MSGQIAHADTDIAAPPQRVWHALTDPELIKQYFFGSLVTTDWQPGSRITWSGEYNGQKYEDRGEVLDMQPQRLLRMTHYSPMTGLPDTPENYHTITIRLEERDGGTHLTLEQDNNKDDGEAERSTRNWEMVLNGLRAIAEGS